MSRPSKIAKFLGSFKLSLILKFKRHDPIGKFTNADRLVFGKLKSAAKVGIVVRPPAVKLGEIPVGKNFRCCANPISIDVLLAPVSRCAMTIILDARSLLKLGLRKYALAVETATEIFIPVKSKGKGEILIPTCVPTGGGGLILKPTL
jgi:hypothetical protein